MPTYAYECTKCACNILEHRPINEPDTPPICLLCNSATRRVYQIAGVTFTGTGWGKDKK